MILMEKDCQKKFVFDCFIPRYRADGWRAEGEADDVQTSPEAPPEQAADETAEQTFICPHCGKEYSKEASLKTHIRRSHAEE